MTDAREARTVTIAPMTKSDVPGVAELEQRLFPGDDPWPEQAFRIELAAGRHYLVAREGGELLGYGGLAVLAGPPRAEAEIHTLGVRPDARRRGIGRALLRRLLAVADAVPATVFLEVRTDNAAAQALYVHEGFGVVGTRKRYYQGSGADAYTMRRPSLLASNGSKGVSARRKAAG
jgi:ribosomal-protein-alanine N-acetyltransferase